MDFHQVFAEFLRTPIIRRLVHLVAHPDEIRIFHGFFEGLVEGFNNLGGKSPGSHQSHEAGFSRNIVTQL